MTGPESTFTQKRHICSVYMYIHTHQLLYKSSATVLTWLEATGYIWDFAFSLSQTNSWIFCGRVVIQFYQMSNNSQHGTKHYSFNVLLNHRCQYRHGATERQGHKAPRGTKQMVCVWYRWCVGGGSVSPKSFTPCLQSRRINNHHITGLVHTH